MKMTKVMTVILTAAMLSGGYAQAQCCDVKVQPVSLQTLAQSAQPAGRMADGLAAQVVAEVNADRAKYGLAPLRTDPVLTEAARIRAQEIAEKFSHTRPDGSSWSTVSAVAYGENIARGHNSADRVMAAWMSSDGHRRNILRESFGSIGVCAYEVNGIIHWVQLFGR